jgi:hypothetical protein
MKLIDKIRAEVEKKTHREEGYRNEDAEWGYRDCASEILSFIDTLEVKEMNSTDAFIEKACEWLKKLVYQEYPGGPLVRQIDDEQLEEFKEAMKGE